MNHKAVKKMYDRIHAKAFAHIPKPDLAIFPALCGMYVGRGDLVVVVEEEHEGVGDLVDTLVHELCHAEQKAQKKAVADNAHHLKLVRKAWERLI